jgi:hypothetical protein
VRQAIAHAQVQPWAQREYRQAELKVVLANLEQRLALYQTGTDTSVVQHSWWRKLLQVLEAFLDAGDAVRRRKRADQIYRDLVNERLSHDQALVALRAISKRQKGGWLSGL